MGTSRFLQGRGVLVLAIVVAATVQLVGWRSFLYTRSNVVERLESWAVMKEEVIYHASAYRDFLETPIGNQGIDLWLGQGFQGMRWINKRQVAVERLTLRTELSYDGSYLYTIFRSGEEGRYALLLSSHPGSPSGFYSFAADWQTLRFVPLTSQTQVPTGVPLEVTVTLRADEFSAYLDGRPVGSFQDGRLAHGTVGFKGGFLPAKVLSVDLEGVEADGNRQFRWKDDFQHGRTVGWWSLIVVVALLATAFAALAAVRSGGSFASATRTAACALVSAAVAVGSTLAYLWTGSVLGIFGGWLALIAGGAVLAGRPPPGGTPSAVSFPRRAALLFAWSGSIVILAVIGWQPLSSATAAAPQQSLAPSHSYAAKQVDLAVGRPYELSGTALGSQRARLQVELAADSLLEIRFAAPEYLASPEYHCTERWNALLLSTVPEINSGFYRYDRGLEPVALFGDDEELAERELDLVIDIAAEGRVSAREGTRILAAGRTTQGAGFGGLYLFKGSADVADLHWEGTATIPTAEPIPRGRSWLWSFVLAAVGLSLAAGKGRFETYWRMVAVGFVVASACLTVSAVLASAIRLQEIEGRFLGWIGIWGQLAVITIILLGRTRWERVQRPALVVVTVVSASWMALGGWSNSFEIVQLEMQDTVPPTPYDLLWYNHASFRACNPYVQWQRFADQRATLPKEHGTTRVITIGASQTLGFGASTLDKSYPGQLEEQLNDVTPMYEVLNAGIPGSYTVTAGSYFEGVLADYEPDIVVINYCAADYLYLSLLSLEGLDPERMIGGVARSGFRDNPALRLLRNARSWYGFREFRAGREADLEWVYGAYERSLGALIESVQSSGAHAFVVLEPKTSEIDHPIIDYPRLYGSARKVAAAFDAHVIDPAARLRRAEQSGIVWWDYAHMTDFGYRVLAEAVASSLQHHATEASE